MFSHSKDIGDIFSCLQQFSNFTFLRTVSQVNCSGGHPAGQWLVSTASIGPVFLEMSVVYIPDSSSEASEISLQLLTQ